MTTIKTTSDTNINTTEKRMANVHSIKINFQGESRDVTLNTRPSPTLAGLQAAVSSAFTADLPPLSRGNVADEDLRFNYKDDEGDDIVFDTDSELSLALRLSPESLEISAARKVESKVSIFSSEEHFFFKPRSSTITPMFPTKPFDILLPDGVDDRRI